MRMFTPENVGGEFIARIEEFIHREGEPPVEYKLVLFRLPAGWFVSYRGYDLFHEDGFVLDKKLRLVKEIPEGSSTQIMLRWMIPWVRRAIKRSRSK
jgi:hypothetical protein